MKRRFFLAATSTAMLVPGLLRADKQKRRVAVIGHTGRGNYGHGLDVVWQMMPGVELCGVADANEVGLAKTLKNLRVDQGYTDYRKMLAEVRPEFVTVSPRHADQHRDMAMAAIEAGVKGLYVEKPFCRTPAEADELITACKKHGAKIAVAHRNRYHPALKQVDKLIDAGELGRLLEIRGRGLGDHRGGGEDLWVLGCHIMNLIHHFAGEPKSCSGIMLQDGHHVTGKDVKDGAEGLGPLAGNKVHARYEMSNGVIAYYDSIANDGTGKNAYCLQLIGSKGTITIHIDRDPLAHFTPGNPFQPTSQPRPWIPISTAGLGEPENQPELVVSVHTHVLAVDDLIEACDKNREPLCNAHAGAVTVEMICAVFESHRRGGETIEFPLKERGNSLQLL
jgi:predicted dehydrogenase